MMIIPLIHIKVEKNIMKINIIINIENIKVEAGIDTIIKAGVEVIVEAIIIGIKNIILIEEMRIIAIIVEIKIIIVQVV
jgi:hypothetical protein